MSPEERASVPSEIRRSFETADGLDKASAQLRKEIVNVPVGKPDTLQLKLKLQALKLWNDPVAGSKFDNRTVGHATCNTFVDSVFMNSGMEAPKRFGWSGRGALGAGEWNAKSEHKIKGGGVVSSIYEHSGRSELDAALLPNTVGVISYKGHVAIYIGHGLTIGSTQSQPMGGRGPVSIISTSDSQPYRILELKPNCR